MRLIAAPTGAGKTTAAARWVAQTGKTCWLADRREDVDAAVQAIEAAGGEVGRVVPLDGETNGVPNCLCPEVINWWQAKGYNYQAGFCKAVCDRKDDLRECPFIMSVAELEHADTIVATKALARRPGFFSAFGNQQRQTVVLDEDPIKLLRPTVAIDRAQLSEYLVVLDGIDEWIRRQPNEFEQAAGLKESQHSRQIGTWLWKKIARQPVGGQPEAVDIPAQLRPTRAVSELTSKARKLGRRVLCRGFYHLMRKDPEKTVRNVCRDLWDLVGKCVAGRTVFVTHEKALFHLRINIPRRKNVVVLDATGNPELLRPLFAPRAVEVLADERVEPAGRIIQLMDFNGPRSYLNQLRPKAVRIIDAIGDLHPQGSLVLISHLSCVRELAKASRHHERIKVAHFGGLRGRNDLETSSHQRIAAHVVMGSPKTTEDARRQLALAVYGRSILPFQDLTTIRRPVFGLIPHELAREEGQRQLWEVRLKGYADPRMQAVYDYTVVAELTHAADRARVLIHQDAVVYLVTNEPCPRLWFAELCFADDLLDLSPGPRSDFREACDVYEAKARELLDAGLAVGNADVCRALGRKPGWGWRYWQVFRERYADALEGVRKVRWKEE